MSTPQAMPLAEALAVEAEAPATPVARRGGAPGFWVGVWEEEEKKRDQERNQGEELQKCAPLLPPFPERQLRAEVEPATKETKSAPPGESIVSRPLKKDDLG